jgi:hypothetical protein
MIHDRVRVESEGGKVEAFYFGNEVPEKNAYFGLREGEDTVFIVDRGKVIELFDLMKKIENETEDYRLQTADNRHEMEDETTTKEGD